MAFYLMNYIFFLKLTHWYLLFLLKINIFNRICIHLNYNVEKEKFTNVYYTLIKANNFVYSK